MIKSWPAVRGQGSQGPRRNTTRTSIDPLGVGLQRPQSGEAGRQKDRHCHTSLPAYTPIRTPSLTLTCNRLRAHNLKSSQTHLPTSGLSHNHTLMSTSAHPCCTPGALHPHVHWASLCTHSHSHSHTLHMVRATTPHPRQQPSTQLLWVSTFWMGTTYQERRSILAYTFDSSRP